MRSGRLPGIEIRRLLAASVRCETVRLADRRLPIEEQHTGHQFRRTLLKFTLFSKILSTS